MAEELFIVSGDDKIATYESLLPQLNALIQGETDLIANLANIAAALQQTFSWLWVGFYLVKENQLILGPFQGPIACTRIGYGKGVCGTTWKNSVETQHVESLWVPDVDKFPGHIACSSSTVSEIVVSILNNNSQVVGVLDVDSESFDVLDQTDVIYLKKISQLISKTL